MQNFEFFNPTKIVFGDGTTDRIGEFTVQHGKRALVLYGGGSAKRTGLLERVTKSLESSGVECRQLGGVKANPILSFVHEAIEIFRAEKLDVVVAVGGGSVIDSAKAIAAGACYTGDVWDFFADKAVAKEAFPITTVLTLAAAASEMNSGAVITNEKTKQKFNFGCPAAFPKVSILDPKTTYTVPVTHSMYGAVDTVVHLVEAYFNSGDKQTPIQDTLVEGLCKVVIDKSQIVFDNQEDYEGRASLMWGATLGLNGITQSGVGPAAWPNHMIEHSLSALYDISHGAGLSIVMPAWMKYKSELEPQKFAQFGRKVFDIDGESDSDVAKRCIAALESWLKKIDTPTTLGQVDIPDDSEAIKAIAENAFMLSKKWGMGEVYTVDVIANILSRAC